MTLLLEIFGVFFKIGFLSFGGVFGVLPELERMIVLEKNWVTSERFVQTYVMGQFLPGPNMVMCPILGYDIAGFPGMVAAFLGIYSPPAFVMGLTFIFYQKLRKNILVQRTEKAVRPVILGLLAASALRLWYLQSSLSFSHRLLSLALVGAAFFVYKKNYLGAFPTIFSAGLLWLGIWKINLFLGIFS